MAHSINPFLPMRLGFLRHLLPLVIATSVGYWLGQRQDTPHHSTPEHSGREPGRPGRRLRPQVVEEVAIETRSLGDVKAIVQSGPQKGKEELYLGALAELSQQDPLAALELLMSKGPFSPEDFDQALEAFRVLAEKSPRQALTMASALTTPSQRKTAMRTVIEGWASVDPAAALQVATLHPETRQGDLWENLGSSWASKDPKVAALQAAGLPPGPLRAKFLQGVANSWIETDIPAFASWFSQLSDRDAHGVISNLNVSGSEKSDMSQITLLWNTLPAGPNRDGIVSNLATALPFTTPAEFAAHLAMVDGMEDNKLKEKLRQHLFETLAERDPFQAAAWIPQLLPGRAADLVQTIATHWAEKDPAAALTWAEALPHEFKTKALGSLVQNMAGDSPEQALAILASHGAILADENGQNVVSQLIYSDADPMTVASLVAQQKGEGHAELQFSLASAWSDKDPFGFAEWANTLKPGQDRDIAAGTLASHLVQTDPEAALVWSLSISEKEHKLENTGEVFRQWFENSPDQARHWLESQKNLPAAQRKNLSDIIKAGQEETAPGNESKRVNLL